MKYITPLAILLMGTQLVSAQSTKKFGIKGGLNEAYINGGPLTKSTVGQFLPGFHVGVFKDFDLGKNWSIQPALFYTIKGYKATIDTQLPIGSLHENGKQTYQYLELPVNTLYNIKIKSSKIFVGGGPYMGYLFTAVGQRNTSLNNAPAVFTETKRVVGGNNGTFKRTDFGLNGLLGFGLKNGLLFSYSISYGLTNIIANQGTNPTAMTKNRVMTFSLGYEF